MSENTLKQVMDAVDREMASPALAKATNTAPVVRPTVVAASPRDATMDAAIENQRQIMLQEAARNAYSTAQAANDQSARTTLVPARRATGGSIEKQLDELLTTMASLEEFLGQQVHRLTGTDPHAKARVNAAQASTSDHLRSEGLLDRIDERIARLSEIAVRMGTQNAHLSQALN